MTDKPLPKSLHTVKVLNLVTHHLMTRHNLTAGEAMKETIHILKLDKHPDTYGLAAIALKQLEATRAA